MSEIVMIAYFKEIKAREFFDQGFDFCYRICISPEVL